MGRIHHSTDGT